MNEILQAKILLRYKGKYLLLKKVKDIHIAHIGYWEVPGGKLKNKEKTEEAAIREIKEETGLSCEIIKELKILKLEKDGIKTVTHVYLGKTSSNKVKLSSEHSDYIWVSYPDIDKLDKVIYKDLFKEYILDAEKINN